MAYGPPLGPSWQEDHILMTTMLIQGTKPAMKYYNPSMTFSTKKDSIEIELCDLNQVF